MRWRLTSLRASSEALKCSFELTGVAAVAAVELDMPSKWNKLRDATWIESVQWCRFVHRWSLQSMTRHRTTKGGLLRLYLCSLTFDRLDYFRCYPLVPGSPPSSEGRLGGAVGHVCVRWYLNARQFRVKRSKCFCRSSAFDIFQPS